MTLAVLAAVAVLVLLNDPRPRSAEPLDPDNPSADGAQAVARVLEDQGVATRVARTTGELESRRVAESTVVVVTQPDLLGENTAARLVQHAARARIVLLEPSPTAAAYLGLDLERVAPENSLQDAACDDPLVSGLTIEVDRATAYDVRGGSPVECFADDGAPLLVRQDGLDVLGAARLLRNDQVLSEDNAAVALRLLGSGEEVVWYVPDPADLSGDEGANLSALLPDWLVPALWLGAVVIISVGAWRGRRLGRVVGEPLPVVVRAVEATHSLGRLYRKSGDRGHAAGLLRSAARRRAVARLRLPRRVDDRALVEAVAAHTGQSPGEVLDLLVSGGAPGSDQDLVRLAVRLAALDREALQA